MKLSTVAPESKRRPPLREKEYSITKVGLVGRKKAFPEKKVARSKSTT